jgi:putative membrane protein
MSTPSLLVSHWQPQPSLDAAALACASLYLLAAHRVRGGWPVVRTLAFLAGVACAIAALQSGIGAYDDRLLSAHMVQHMLLLLAAPLLLLSGHPLLLALRALPPSRRRPLARVLDRARAITGPLQCLAIFYDALLLTHLPAFYDAAVAHPLLHEAEHGLYLVAGGLMWWPILGVDPAPKHRLGGLGRIVYMLATMPPMAVIGAYLNRHPSLVYSPYGPPAHALGISAVTDQQQAGAIMWVAGNTLMIVVGLWAVIAELIAEERRQQVRDARTAPRTAGGLR